MRKAEKLMYKSVYAYNKNKKTRAKVFNLILRVIFACDIPYSVKIGKNVQLVHNGLGCVFHPKVNIGSNCKIYQNVTLGGNGKIIDGVLTNKGGPTLEEGVTVFSGACVLGSVKIGKNSIIGANAVVLNDVPENSIAVGVPVKIKPKTSEYNFN
ncbi:hypothetical protein [uncultured Ilyobacter sp.]|uniref:serine O-acetyltransferase n=1 Tax=uncultured Ilyobacter sp. TaxID=544433 RepID=UPI0029C75D63|nr:hypothetical protein [uncultured Ilyobacter sp.]